MNQTLIDNLKLFPKIVDNVFRATLSTHGLAREMCADGLYPIREFTVKFGKETPTAVFYACPVTGNIGYASQNMELLEGLGKLHTHFVNNNGEL